MFWVNNMFLLRNKINFPHALLTRGLIPSTGVRIALIKSAENVRMLKRMLILTLFILMDIPKHIDTISMGLSDSPFVKNETL